MHVSNRAMCANSDDYYTEIRAVYSGRYTRVVVCAARLDDGRWRVTYADWPEVSYQPKDPRVAYSSICPTVLEHTETITHNEYVRRGLAERRYTALSDVNVAPYTSGTPPSNNNNNDNSTRLHAPTTQRTQ